MNQQVLERPQASAKKPKPKRPTAEYAGLSPTETNLLKGVHLAPSPSIWRFLSRNSARWFGDIHRDEFVAVCDIVRAYLDGRAVHPDVAAKKAQKLISAYLDRNVGAAVAMCDETFLAVMVVYVGSPRANFFYSRSIQLKDPKGAKTR